MKTTTAKEDPFLQSYTPPDLKIAAEFLANWLPFLTKTLCHNCTQTLSNTISSLDPDFYGETLPVKEINCDCNNGDVDDETNSLGSWKDSAMGCSKYVPEALPVSWVWEESAMGCSNCVNDGDNLVVDSPVGRLDHVGDSLVFSSVKLRGGSKSDNVVEAVNVGSDESLGRWKSDYVDEARNVGYSDTFGGRNRVDSAVGCSDHVGDTLVFGSLGSWQSDYVAEAVDVGSPDSHGRWKSDYVPEDEDRNVGSPNSLGSWISNYVPEPRVVGSPDSSLGSWKSDYVPGALTGRSPNLHSSWKSDYVPEAVDVGSPDSLGSWKSSEMECLDNVPEALESGSPKLLGSWNDSSMGKSDSVPEATFVNSLSFQASWADMAEDEFEDDDDIGEEEENEKVVQKRNVTLTKVQREYLRFKMVKRKKDFTCLRRVNGTRTNILEGLELHTGVFSAAEQKHIVDFIYALEEKGKKGELQERTFSAPEKWMPGKGRVTIQFGCCYNYAVLKDGSPPGILRNKQVDPMPQLFKVMIRRLVAWHILPPTCVPDSCIVNIYEEGDCIPPHIDHHDFLRPFCTVSFLSECNILFGSTLKIVGPGEFSGDVAIPLPLGSVLILNGNGADVAKHCVPKVPTKRISITFRKMDESKHPDGFVPEPDLQFLEPLPFERDLHSPRRDTDWVGILPTPFNDDYGHKGTRSSDFPSLQKDRQSPRTAPKSVGYSNFLSPQENRNTFRVAPKTVDSSKFLPPQKDRESSNPGPKNVDTSDFSQHRRNRQSFRFDPKNLESESLPLQKETQSIRVSPQSVGSSVPPLHQKDRDSLKAASKFPPPQRNRQSLQIEIDSETGKRSSSHGGSSSEPPRSSIEPCVSSSETRYSSKKALYSGIGTQYSGPHARYSSSDTRYTGSDPRYSGKKAWYSGIATPYSGSQARYSNTSYIL